VKKQLKIKLDLYRILQITSVSLLDKKPLKSLFSDEEVQFDVKSGSNQLNFQGF
jgi:hypothetical protein